MGKKELVGNRQYTDEFKVTLPRFDVHHFRQP